MLEAVSQFTNSPENEDVRSTRMVGLAMLDVLAAADTLRLRLDERGDDAEKVMAALHAGISSSWEAIG